MKHGSLLHQGVHLLENVYPVYDYARKQNWMSPIKRKHGGGSSSGFSKKRLVYPSPNSSNNSHSGRRVLFAANRNKKTKYTMKKGLAKKSKSSTKGSMEQNTLSNLHSGVDVRTWKMNIHKPVKSAMGTTSRLYETRQVVNTSGAGVQGVFEIYFTGTQDQWLSNHVPALPYQGEYAYFDINPNCRVTGSGIFTAGAFPTTDRLIMKNEVLEMDISNMTNSATQHRIYAFVCKKYTSFGPIALWNQDLFDMGGSGPGAAVAPTALLPAINTPGYLGAQFPYMGPTGCKTLSTFFKLQGVQEFDLAPAAHQRLRIDLIHNQLGVKETFNKAANLFVPGTVVLVNVQIGVPVLDNTNGNNATYSLCESAITFVSKKVFQPVKNNAGRVKALVGWDAIPAGASGGNQKIVNILDASATVFAV